MSEDGTQPARRLVRDTEHKVITGVCSGLGRYTGIDSLVFRVAFAVLVLTNGLGWILYVAALLIMAPSDERDSKLERKLGRRLDGDTTLALLGVLLGGLTLAGIAESMGGGPFQRGPIGGLSVIVMFTLALLIAHSRGVDLIAMTRTLPGRVRQGMPASAFASAPGAAFSGSHAAPGDAFPASTTYAPGGLRTDGMVDLALLKPADGPVERGGRWPFFTPLVLLGGGLASAVMIAPAAAHSEVPRAQILIASALCVIGLGLIVGGVFGQGRWLVAIGAALSLALAATSVAGPLTSGRVGDVSWRPAEVAQIEDPYKISAGDGALDLTALSLEPGQRVDVRVQIGVGELRVTVPRTVRVEVHATAALGDVQVDQRTASGPRARVDTVLEPDGAPRQTATIKLSVEAQLGDLEVRRA